MNNGATTIETVNANVQAFLAYKKLSEYTTEVRKHGTLARLGNYFAGREVTDSVVVYDKDRTRTIGVDLVIEGRRGLSNQKGEIHANLYNQGIFKDLGIIVKEPKKERGKDLALELETQVTMAAQGRRYQERESRLTEIVNKDYKAKEPETKKPKK